MSELRDIKTIARKVVRIVRYKRNCEEKKSDFSLYPTILRKGCKIYDNYLYIFFLLFCGGSKFPYKKKKGRSFFSPVGRCRFLMMLHYFNIKMKWTNIDSERKCEGTLNCTLFHCCKCCGYFSKQLSSYTKFLQH